MFAKISTWLIANVKNKTNWLSFITGLSLVFAYAPFNQWWLPFVVLPIWLSQLAKLTARPAAKQGYIFALGWFISGISWVHVSIAEFGGMPLIASLALMALLCAYLAIFPALSCYLSAKLTKDKNFSFWLFPAFWLVCEYLRAVVLTGFPWLSLGYSQINSPLAVFAPVIGEIGITFVLLISSIAIYQTLQKSYIKTNLAIITSITLMVVLLPQKDWLQKTDKTIKVALVQGNIQQSLKWQPEQEWPTMLKYLDLSRINYDAQLIIWPESAIPAVEPLAQDFLDTVNQSANINGASIITGIINYDFASKDYYNSLIVLGKKNNKDPNGSYYYETDNRYYKNHLLPIGEFVPFEDILRPLAPFFNLPMSSFSRGDYKQQNLVAQDLNILPLLDHQNPLNTLLLMLKTYNVNYHLIIAILLKDHNHKVQINVVLLLY